MNASPADTKETNDEQEEQFLQLDEDFNCHAFSSFYIDENERTEIVILEYLATDEDKRDSFEPTGGWQYDQTIESTQDKIAKIKETWRMNEREIISELEDIAFERR